MNLPDSSIIATGANWLPVLAALSGVVVGFLCCFFFVMRPHLERPQHREQDRAAHALHDAIQVCHDWATAVYAASQARAVANPYHSCRPGEPEIVAAERLRLPLGDEFANRFMEAIRVASRLGLAPPTEQHVLTGLQREVFQSSVPMAIEALAWWREKLLREPLLDARRLKKLRNAVREQVKPALSEEAVNDHDIVRMTRADVRAFVAWPLMTICALLCVLSITMLPGTSFGFGVFFGSAVLGYESFLLLRASRGPSEHKERS